MATFIETPAVADLAGGPIPYVLRRSGRARSLRVTIHPERGVVVTIPVRGSERDGNRRADAFLREREPWLRRHLARHQRTRDLLRARGGARDGGAVPFRGVLHVVRVVAIGPAEGRTRIERVGGVDGDELVIYRRPRERRPVASILESWLRERAWSDLERAVARHAASLDVVPLGIALRDPRTRWGSASRTGRLNFSWRLIMAPPEALDTVVVHELAHLRVFGHGPGFWRVVASRRPDHARWRRWLHDHAGELHGALGQWTSPVEPARSATTVVPVQMSGSTSSSS